MRKLLALLFTTLFAVAGAWGAVDVNKATQAELESIKGIGPATSAKILDERKKSAFKDWPDLIARVGGIGESTAAKYSGAGLTVGGTSFKPAAAAAPASGPASAAKPAEKKPAAKKPAASAAASSAASAAAPKK